MYLTSVTLNLCEVSERFFLNIFFNKPTLNIVRIEFLTVAHSAIYVSVHLDSTKFQIVNKKI